MGIYPGNFARSEQGPGGSVPTDMTTSHALGFALLGMGMIFLPAYAPESFLAKAMDGSNTSTLWLELMGGMNFLLGMITALRNELTRLALAFEAMDLPGRQMLDLSEVQWTMPASLYEFELAAVEEPGIRSAA